VFPQELNLQPFGLLVAAVAAVLLAVTAINTAAVAAVLVDYKAARSICHRLRVQLFLMLLVQVAQAAHKQQGQEILAQTAGIQLLVHLDKLGIYQLQAVAAVKAATDKAIQEVAVVVTEVHHHLARQAVVVVELVEMAIARGLKSQLIQ
jgi:hypothetical protein